MIVKRYRYRWPAIADEPGSGTARTEDAVLIGTVLVLVQGVCKLVSQESPTVRGVWAYRPPPNTMWVPTVGARAPTVRQPRSAAESAPIRTRLTSCPKSVAMTWRHRAAGST